MTEGQLNISCIDITWDDTSQIYKLLTHTKVRSNDVDVFYTDNHSSYRHECLWAFSRFLVS